MKSEKSFWKTCVDEKLVVISLNRVNFFEAREIAEIKVNRGLNFIERKNFSQ